MHACVYGVTAPPQSYSTEVCLVCGAWVVHMRKTPT